MTTTPRMFPRSAAAVIATALLLGSVSPAMAEQTYRDDSENPFRIAYYVLAPVGEFLKWGVTDPLRTLSDATIPPKRPVDEKWFRGCSRERPARSCTGQIQ